MKAFLKDHGAVSAIIAAIILAVGGVYAAYLGTRGQDLDAAKFQATLDAQKQSSVGISEGRVNPVEDPSLIPVEIELSSGVVQTIRVNPVVGEIGRLVTINQEENEAIPIKILPDWIWGNELAPMPTVWDAYQLPHENSLPCSAWPSRFRVASMRFSVSGLVLAFAYKGGEYPSQMLIPMMGEGNIPILDNISRGDLPNGAGPLNASIQVFLAQQHTVGTIAVYDENDFKGNECTLSIGT